MRSTPLRAALLGFGLSAAVLIPPAGAAPRRAVGPGRMVTNPTRKVGPGPGQFTITPRKPFIAGKGSLQAFGPSMSFSANTNDISFTGGGAFSVTLQVTAGQTYRIDESFRSTARGCRYTVNGDDGETLGVSCGPRDASGDTHLIFRYVAVNAGPYTLKTTVPPGAVLDFTSATVKRVK